VSTVSWETHNLPRRVGPVARRRVVNSIVNGPASVFMGQEGRLLAGMFADLGWETTPQTLDVWQSLPICWDPDVFRLIEFRAVEHYAEGKRDGDRSWGAGPGGFAAGVTPLVVLEHHATDHRWVFGNGHLEASAGRRAPNLPAERENWEQRRANHATEVAGIRDVLKPYARRGLAVVQACDWNADPESDLVSAVDRDPFEIVAPDKPTHPPHATIDYFAVANVDVTGMQVIDSPSDHQRVRATGTRVA
jgi:hypothetical protein